MKHLKLFEEFNLNENIKFEEELINHHHGQSDLKLKAFDEKGDLMGYIEYSEFEDKPSVQYIKTLPEHSRKGVATNLLLELQKKYPDVEIGLGYSTDDGSKLLDTSKLKRTYYPNKEYQEKSSRLKKCKERSNILTKRYEDWGKLYDTDRDEADRQRSELFKFDDEFHDLNDEIYDLEKELDDMEQGIHLFDIK